MSWRLLPYMMCACNRRNDLISLPSWQNIGAFPVQKTCLSRYVDYEGLLRRNLVASKTQNFETEYTRALIEISTPADLQNA